MISSAQNLGEYLGEWQVDAEAMKKLEEAKAAREAALADAKAKLDAAKAQAAEKAERIAAQREIAEQVRTNGHLMTAWSRRDDGVIAVQERAAALAARKSSVGGAGARKGAAEAEAEKRAIALAEYKKQVR